MNTDSITIIIAAAGGALVSAMVACAWVSVFFGRVKTRAEKETWAAANMYYSRKARP